MRVGQNPEKTSERKLVHKRHRVIIPVYIPNEEGFYAQSVEVFHRTMESLFETTGDETNITIVNNNSIGVVEQSCREWVKSDKIDRYIAYSENRGKAEVVLAAARGSWEDYITVADADILFFPGWLEKVSEAFSTFPKLGVCGLLTSPFSQSRATSTVYLDTLTRFSLKKDKVVSDEVIREFTRSTGLSDSDREKMMLASKQHFLSKNGQHFLLGANHAAATYAREIFFHERNRKVIYPFRRKAKLIKSHFDIPSDKLGFWRMSFPRPLAYHMGNVPESPERTEALQFDFPSEIRFPEKPPKQSLFRLLPYGLRSRLVNLFLKLTGSLY